MFRLPLHSLALRKLCGILGRMRERLMISSPNGDTAVSPQPKIKSVSAAILSEFFDELSKDESLTDIEPRLRKTVLDENIFAEPAIRAALFPETP